MWGTCCDGAFGPTQLHTAAAVACGRKWQHCSSAGALLAMLLAMLLAPVFLGGASGIYVFSGGPTWNVKSIGETDLALAIALKFMKL